MFAVINFHYCLDSRTPRSKLLAKNCWFTVKWFPKTLAFQHIMKYLYTVICHFCLSQCLPETVCFPERSLYIHTFVYMYPVPIPNLSFTSHTWHWWFSLCMQTHWPFSFFHIDIFPIDHSITDTDFCVYDKKIVGCVHVITDLIHGLIYWCGNMLIWRQCNGKNTPSVLTIFWLLYKMGR